MTASNFNSTTYLVDQDSASTVVGDPIRFRLHNGINLTAFWEAGTSGTSYIEVNNDTDTLVFTGNSTKWVPIVTYTVDGSTELSHAYQVTADAFFIRFRFVPDGGGSTGDITVQYSVKSYGS